MSKSTRKLILNSPEATAALAAQIGTILRAGDVLLLQGPIGAGKTHFARSLIQSLLSYPEDVPSPTFTLVQVYETPAFEIWHSDLYRVSSPDEIEELGLSDAFEEAVCLIEWPDRMGELRPESALALDFVNCKDSDTRELTASWADPDWSARLNRVIS